LYQKMRDYRRALADFDRAVEVGPQYGVCYDSRALLLASAPEGQGRNGPQALEDARRACDITGWRRPEMLGTLAAAYAAVGDFQQAIHWQETAIQLGADQPAFLHAAESRMRQYRRGLPLRDE
jgi:tetratricopeptide (TPR) repeat protein